MNLSKLALRNISGSAFRSWVVALCALLVASFTLSTRLIIHGAEESLKLASARLGADILVVPEGSQSKVETALLMGHPASVWMPENVLGKVAQVKGVEQATPQLYLSTLNNASCCSVSNMFLVAYDPTSDFTVQPWLVNKTGGGLKLGEAVGGTHIFVPEGEQDIQLYGYFITLKANLEPTGTGMDQSMFVTFDTAADIARISKTMAEKPLEIPPDSISAVLVKVAPGQDPSQVAVQIMHDVPGVVPIESPNLFRSYRQQITGLMTVVLILIVGTVTLSVLLIGMVFSLAANERRRELGVLRALGATRGFIFLSLLAEAGILALSGAAGGIALTILVITLFRQLIITTLGIPFLFPSFYSLLTQTGGGLLLALCSVTVAAFVPAYRISHQEPSIAMRE